MRVPVDADFTFVKGNFYIPDHWYGSINKVQEAHLFPDYAGHTWRFCKCNPTIIPVNKVDPFTKYETFAAAIYLHNQLVNAVEIDGPIVTHNDGSYTVPLKAVRKEPEVKQERIRKRSNPRSALTEEIQRLKEKHG